MIKQWLKNRMKWRKIEVVTFEGKHLFWRYSPLWMDEYPADKNNVVHHYKLPWWLPFNVLLHKWDPEPDTKEAYHDHPRWSVTVCLRGKLIEHTPWGDTVLTPGSIVFRTHKAIHAFSVPEGYSGKTWTMFIVGRRKHRQNGYVVTPQ